MKNFLAALIAGFVFALGLCLSGMTQPEKVLAFLNVRGLWDPSLAFVMAGAIALHGAAYHLWLKRRSLSLPPRKGFDKRLIGGALLFGCGWGLAGYCPGPALVSVIAWPKGLGWFLGAYILGTQGASRLRAKWESE